MNETVRVGLTYDSDSTGTSLANDAMLFALDLEFAARNYGLRFACNSNPSERRLDLMLSGNSENVDRFIQTLRSKELDYVGVKDYRVGERREYRGKEPDWGYHDSLVAMRASYLRTAYMTDVRQLLERLADHPKLSKISA